MMSHTPGPWKCRLEKRTVIYHEDEMGEKAIAVGAGSYPDSIANARLIAAAPDLLAACTGVWANLGTSDNKWLAALASSCRAAMLKAIEGHGN